MALDPQDRDAIVDAISTGFANSINISAGACKLPEYYLIS